MHQLRTSIVDPSASLVFCPVRRGGKGFLANVSTTVTLKDASSKYIMVNHGGCDVKCFPTVRATNDGTSGRRSPGPVPGLSEGLETSAEGRTFRMGSLTVFHF